MRAALSCCFRLAVSDGREDFRLRGFGLDDFSLRKPGLRAVDSPDLRARRPPRPAVVPLFPLFSWSLPFVVPLAKIPDPKSGRKYLQSKGAMSEVGQKLP